MKQLIHSRWICVWLALQATVYLAFLAIDLFHPELWMLSTALKYLSILLCLAMAIRSHGLSWNQRDSSLLITALAMTCLADLFLLVLNLPLPGLLVFCAVHAIYLRRYYPALFYRAAWPVAGVALAALAAGLLISSFPAQEVLASLYGCLLWTATVSAFLSPLPRRNRRLASAGMVLFVLCDIHVALFNTLSAGNPYFPMAAVLMWFFYLPSQVLLTCSSIGLGEIEDKVMRFPPAP